MHATSQIILKNLSQRPDCQNGLWINPGHDDAPGSIRQAGTGLSLFCQNYNSYRYQLQNSEKVSFSAFGDGLSNKFNWIVLTLPRHKALLAMLLDCASSLLASDGVLWLAGENKAGIKSSERLLKRFFDDTHKLDNARHCTLYQARKPVQMGVFDATQYRQSWSVNYAGKSLKMLSYPGVFAHGHLDAGTALLLEALPDLNLDGNILDFGCGAGVIGTCIASRQPSATLSFLDSSALALQACKETLAANHLQGTLLASDGLSEVNGNYDHIISNPPIHSGIKTDNHLSLRLLDDVNRFIAPCGSMIVVANRHLPYEHWLHQRFKRLTELVSNNAFKVYQAKK